ncbi:solute carrier family 35 (UDP-galactose transporter), member B1 [Strigomonas culicis]|uniref:Solute carrier family 35 (UDP-galactose transporter), member B1 n=1 Tax=Strigomonas culicis TaxID=28005 RepID=S9W9P4_9TRYP|nr:solute carrier family 35 (UDP-galactose transporter), member B1 [Strigomonas culicis]|eukprot:EPY36001.1 solute carrier family 35 (UDP-galactose transporter), member B1 [Strigomonas culicis]
MPSAPHGNAKVLLQMLFCVCGIYVCFAYWSLLQEKLVKRPYVLKPQPSAPPLGDAALPQESLFSAVFTILLFQAIAGAAVGHVLCLLEGRNADAAAAAPTWHREDCYQVLSVGLTGVFGTSLGYAAMRRLSYPVVLSAKMSKMIPVMIVGTLVHRFRYPLVKVLACLLITAGVLSFYLLEDTAKLRARDQGRHSPSEGRVGLLLLFFNLLSDGYMNSTQDALVKRQRLTGNQLMRLMNLVYTGLLLALLLLLEVVPEAAVQQLVGAALQPVSPAAATAAQRLVHEQVAFCDLSRTLRFMRHYAGAGRDLLVMSGCNALGQYFIFRTIYLFGSLTVTAMTLVRKVGSVVLSIVVHGYPVLPLQCGSLLLVLVGVVLEAKSNLKAKAGGGHAASPERASIGSPGRGSKSTAEWLEEMRRLSHRTHRTPSASPVPGSTPTRAIVSPSLQQRIDLVMRTDEREREEEAARKKKLAEGRKTIQWNTTPISRSASRGSSSSRASPRRGAARPTAAPRSRSTSPVVKSGDRTASATLKKNN